MKIALVMPVFNEEDVILKYLNVLTRQIKTIIAVNDGSTDNTKKILLKFPITLINNKKNVGYVKSLEIGIKKAFSNGADFVITIDSDGQHDPKDIKRMISIIEKYKPDLILTERSKKNRFMENVIGLYSKMKYKISDPLSGMKAYSKNLFYKYDSKLENKYTIATELVYKAIKDKVRFIEIPIKINKRINESRFGNQLIGNFLELRAFLNILFI